jgi:hypothetical protein
VKLIFPQEMKKEEAMTLENVQQWDNLIKKQEMNSKRKSLSKESVVPSDSSRKNAKNSSMNAC